MRVTLTKAHLSTNAGKKLVDLCLSLGLDGEFSNDDLAQLADFTAGLGNDIPGVVHLRVLLQDSLGDGIITEDERRLLHAQIERVLPITERERLARARQTARFATPQRSERRLTIFPPSDAQLRYIESLGGQLPEGATKADASLLIDRLIRSNGSISPRQRMVLRFWGVTPPSDWGKPQVSEWMDRWYAEDPDRLAAWENFKEATGDTGRATDPERVPFDAGKEWLAKVKTPPMLPPSPPPSVSAPVRGRPPPIATPALAVQKEAGGCLAVLLVVGFVMLAGSLLASFR